jgi:hypothetical protein
MFFGDTEAHPKPNVALETFLKKARLSNAVRQAGGLRQTWLQLVHHVRRRALAA